MINGFKRIEEGELWLGELKLRQVPTVPPNTSIAVELAFPDYIGDNSLLLKDRFGRTISNALEVFVQPALMDYEQFERLRDEHVPGLIQSAGAEDTAAQTYPGATPAIEEETINFNIAQLLEFSKALLGVTRKVLDLLSYRIETERKHLKGHLRGSIRWAKTAVARSQKGVDYATVHISDIRKRKWNTPTNLLLVRFHMEVFMEAIFFRDEIDRREREKKAWATIYNTPYEGLDPQMKERMDTLEAVLKVHKEVLTNLKLKPLILEAKELRKGSEVFRRKAPEEASRVKNRSYRDLIDLWNRFLEEYESYYEDVVQIHTRRMRDLYALWVATEIASALKLRASAKSLRQFHSPRRDIRLNYDAPGQVRQGWSDSILAMLFDEEGEAGGGGRGGATGSAGGGGGGGGAVTGSSGGPELFLHYKGLEIYLEARYDLRQRPQPQDVYKVLAFMSNYKAPCGIILYPGPRLKLTYSREQQQVLAWIPFGPRSNIFDIANDYLKFAMENVADLYRFMEEGKPVAKLAELIEAAAAEYYATGGATQLPETERWEPPPEEDLLVDSEVEPQVPPARPAVETGQETEPEPAVVREPQPPDTISPDIDGPFGADDETGAPPEEMELEPPTPEEALEMEAEAHEDHQAEALEEALDEGLPPTAEGVPKPPSLPAERRRLDYPVRKRKHGDDEGIQEEDEPTEGPDDGKAAPDGIGQGPEAPSTERRQVTPHRRRRDRKEPGPPMAPGEPEAPQATATPGPKPGSKPASSRLAWTPSQTSKQEYKPISDEGESLHLSMDKLRDLVHKVEDKAWTESTEWEEEEKERRNVERAEREAGEAGESGAASEAEGSELPLTGLKPTDDLPSEHPSTPFKDPKDLPQLPKGSDWVGKEERRRLEEGGPLEAAKGTDDRADEGHDRWRKPKKGSR